jgi:hypothetical protein
MALPLDPTQPGTLSSPGLGDDEIRALKQFLVDAFGIPVSPNAVATPVSSIATNGAFTFSSPPILPLVSPGVAGQLGRNATLLEHHNGLALLTIPGVTDRSNNLVTVGSNLGPVNVYLGGVQANLLGTTGRLRLTAIGRVNIKANHTLTITSAWQGVGNLVSLPLVGGITTDRTLLALEVIIEIFMNNATNSQRAKMKAVVTNAAIGTDSPAWGAPGGSNVALDIADSSTNMAAAQTLQLFVQWSHVDAADSVSFYQFLGEIF